MSTKTFFIAAFLFAVSFLFGQNQLAFRHLSTDHGLSQGQVNYILKDSKGFVWIGTQDGLNRYDGYSFKHFYHRDGDSTSLSNNYIWCLLEDSNHDIWVGTFGGELCRFDRETETFQSFPLKPFSQPTIAGNSVRALCEHPEGTLWIGADKGLWSLDIGTLKLEKRDFYVPENSGAAPQTEELLNVVAVHPLAENQLLIGAGQGLFRINGANGQIRPLLHGGQRVPSTASIIDSAEKNWFLAGTENGLFQLEYFPEKDSVRVRKGLAYDGFSPSRSINVLYFDARQSLWIGTNEGLSRISGLELAHFVQQENDPASLSNNMVYSILEIEPGLMWAGTRGGVNIFSNEEPTFLNLRFAANSGKALCSGATLGMLEDGADNLWVGTREGLTRIGHFSKDKRYWDIECLTPANTPSMPYHYVVNVIQDKQGDIWCCFRRNGFAKLKQAPSGAWYFEKTTRFDAGLGTIGMNNMLFDGEGFTWLATPGEGLVKWQQETGEFEIFKSDSTAGSLKHPYIFCLFEDSQGRFWVGTANGGLCEMDKKTGSFDCHVLDNLDGHSISSNMVLSIMEDSRQRIWACTAHGLNLMVGEGRFRRFFQKDGLPNDVVYGLLEDAENNLWASTNKGLSKISFEDGVFKTQNFTAADGLPGNEFNQHSFLKTKDGELVFGGTNGFTIFDPGDIRPYPYTPEVALTDFQLFNESVPISASGILQKAINETLSIRLGHKQNFIAFEFAALGFVQPENNRYAYMMEGLDEDWIHSGNRRFASYPNLPPGGYVFKIKAANHDGIWSETAKTIAIEVLSPWWKTWWAYSVYAILTALIIYATVRFREQSVREIERAKVLERERFRKRTARDFHDEAGNKITKMSLLTEVAKRQSAGNKALPPLLAQMEETIQELRSGMRDFIWVLDPENDNLYDTLLRLKGFANGLFEHTPIRFHTVGIAVGFRQIPLNGNERRHLLLIFKEAMNNCVKYSEAGEAVLSAEAKAGRLTIGFFDDGKGFDPSVATGNGLRNMRERGAKIGGEVTVKSDRGTRVQLVLSSKNIMQNDKLKLR